MVISPKAAAVFKKQKKQALEWIPLSEIKVSALDYEQHDGIWQNGERVDGSPGHTYSAAWWDPVEKVDLWSTEE